MIKAVFHKIDTINKVFQFELFGLDFMIDDKFKVWLIEANTNPDITVTSPVLAKVIPPMLENLFRIAVDPIFPPT